MEIIQKRIEERNKVIEEASKFAKSLDFRCTVVLIGSYARGDFNLWSDVDLLIVGNFKGNPIERLKSIDLPPGYEAIMLTPEEVSKMQKTHSKFIEDAMRDGVIIRDDYGLFSKGK
ncbi:nucleotidyltransferase domain-containing protein [Thermoplasma sp.]|uniref:nucleotidyltransferase domain-containing protein n=1 Tax=Thermoplasma sp. TaxID=1973142 RepID=UPI00128634D8|nr:nucleotidyltransferase domain-containing protein [Thermoplasma sp.]KAA8922165.1 MAG: nucleotidyltransferase domain-containing protein [Thermoplasma sp.]